MSQYNVSNNFNTIFSINEILAKQNILQVDQFISELSLKCKKECVYSIATTISNLIIRLSQDKVNYYIAQQQKQAFNLNP